MIVPYSDGPYLVRGPARIHDQDGRPIVVTRSTIALCRCGKSRMRPFCDGTHRLVGFCAPSHAERPRPESEAHTAADRSRAPNGEDAAGPHAAAVAQLVRAGAKVDSLLAAAPPGEADMALRAAAPLIAAARLLLAQSGREPFAQTPSLCLIREALAVLSSAGGMSQPGICDLVGPLTSVARTLERNGSWW